MIKADLCDDSMGVGPVVEGPCTLHGTVWSCDSWHIVVGLVPSCVFHLMEMFLGLSFQVLHLSAFKV